MTERPPLMIQTGRQPFEVFLLVGCVLTGLAGLLAPESASPALTQLLDGHVWIWHVSVLAVPLIVLLGFTRELTTALQVERAGMIWLGSLFLAYAVGIGLVINGTRGLTSAGVTVAFALACFARVWQIGRDLRRLRQAVEAAETTHPELLADPDAEFG